MQRAILIAAMCITQIAWAQEAPPDPALAKRLSGTRISVEFDKAPLHKVLHTWAQLAQASFILDPAAQSGEVPAADAKITLRAEDMPAGEFLRKVAEAAGLQVCGYRNVFVITDARKYRYGRAMYAGDKEGLKFNLESDGERFGDVIETLSRLCNRKARLAPARKDLSEARIHLAFHDLSDWEALEALCQAAQVDMSAGEGEFVLCPLPPPGSERVRKYLDETTVSFRFQAQPAQEAVDELRIRGRVNVVLDTRKLRPDAAVTLQMNDAKLGDALAAVAGRLGLKHAVLLGVVYVSDDATLARLAAPHADFADEEPSALDRRVRKTLDDRIASVTFNQQPLDEAVEFLEAVGDVKIILDRTTATPAGRTVTLRLENTPMRTWVTLLAEQLGADWVIKNGAVHIVKK